MGESGISRRQTLALAMGGLFALTSDEASAQGQTNLTFWTVRLNTPELAAALKQILADFEKENPEHQDQARAGLGQSRLSEVHGRHARTDHA